MLNDRIFLAVNGQSLARADKMDEHWRVKHSLDGMKINVMVNVPYAQGLILIGTQENGVLISEDSGKTWRSIGLDHIPVKSLAVDPQDSRTIYAGCKQVSLFKTDNLGETWSELRGMRKKRKWWWFSPADQPGFEPYVNALAVSPEDSEVILAGIELGAVRRSEDGGRS